MDNIALIIHSVAAAVLVGGMVLLFLAVTPATWLIDDATLRRAVTRVVTRRFAMLTGIALLALLVTGIYQFTSDTITPPDVQDDIANFRFGRVFMVKMVLVPLLVIVIAVHGMWFGPRIGRATDAVVESNNDADAVFQLESLRRTSLIFSFGMLILGLAIFGLGVTLGNHGYSHVPIP
ncbi:MAG TPA: hypothetical protein QGI71_03880 [Dehalococcoidia bacterium]|nr:hypothetical protein [Dehalococcoidia bacterium]